MDTHDRYELASVDFTDESDAERRHAWIQAVSQGFHQGRVKPEAEKVWVEVAVADRARTSGIWRREGEYGAGPRPVATYTSFDGTLNTGTGLVPLWMITDVTVSAAHRRRGLLTRMMLDDLAAAKASGAPLAALTSSEGSIYGRFGFAPATFHSRVKVDTSHGFALRERVERHVELVEPADLHEVVVADFDHFHATTRGSVSRPTFYRPWLTGEFDPDTGAPDDKLRGALTLDAHGTPDGHVLFRIEKGDDGNTLRVFDLIARTDEARLALWQFLGEVDLVSKVSANLPLDDPLPWALVDPRRVEVERVGDHIWLRVLDVPAALTARPWYADGAVTLGVWDGQGHADGTFRLSVAGGRPSVEEGGEAEISLDVATLSALHLGATSVRTLVAAGRIAGSDEALARFAALADGGPTPYAKTFF